MYWNWVSATWLWQCSLWLTTGRGRYRKRWFPASPGPAAWRRPSGCWRRRGARGGSTPAGLSERWSTSSAGSWYHPDPPERGHIRSYQWLVWIDHTSVLLVPLRSKAADCSFTWMFERHCAEWCVCWHEKILEGTVKLEEIKAICIFIDWVDDMNTKWMRRNHFQ